MRKWLVTIIGIALMAASVYGYSRFADRVDLERKTATTIKPSRLLVSGEIVDASMLRSVTVPVDAIQPGALTNAQDIIGKTVTVPMGSEEQIFHWKLAEDQITPGKGQRYISFKTDDVTNVGNMIRKGDRVDVWVEFSQAIEIGGQLTGAVKIIEGLRVASVKTAEGAEVTDTASFNVPFQDSGRQNERVRGTANAKPDINTFIMSEEVYEAFTFAGLVGTVKLALPDLTLREPSTAQVTDDYEKLKLAVSLSEPRHPPQTGGDG